MTGFTWFDLTLAGLMIISGLLALMRGFTREITSLVAWGGAGAAGAIAAFTPSLVQQAQTYIPTEWIAKIAVGGAVFLVVLIILSVISIRFTDWLLDSSPGAFDRTLGFFFGLARGLVLVIIAYGFYIFFTPVDKRLDGIREARVLPQVEKIFISIADLLPGDNGDTLKEKTFTFARKNTAPETKTQTDNTTTSNSNPIKQGDKKVLDQLIENTQKKTNTNQN